MDTIKQEWKRRKRKMFLSALLFFSTLIYGFLASTVIEKHRTGLSFYASVASSYQNKQALQAEIKSNHTYFIVFRSWQWLMAISAITFFIVWIINYRCPNCGRLLKDSPINQFREMRFFSFVNKCADCGTKFDE